MSNNAFFSSFAVRVNGLVDIDATCDKFRASLAAYVESTKFDLEETVKAVQTVYSGPGMKLGTRLNSQALVSAVMGALNASPTAFNSVKERVESLIKSDPRLHQQKGRNGGICWVPEGYEVHEGELREIPKAAE